MNPASAQSTALVAETAPQAASIAPPADLTAFAVDDIPLTPADLEAFDSEITQLNLRHMQWFAIAGNVFLWVITVLLELYHLPLKDEAHFFDGLLCLVGLVSFGLIPWIRRRPVTLRWPRVLVLTNATLFLGILNAYYMAMTPYYGNTSMYIVGTLGTVLFFRLSLRVLIWLLLINHAVFLALIFTVAEMPEGVVISSAIDCTGAVVLAGVAGSLLYHAHWQNFCKERIITARNRELARLHQLELSEKVAAQLAEEKARLEVLRYQLNPHFLFNALTSVCSQLPPSLTGARATIERLTDFCQLTLFKPANDTHPTLGDELKLLHAYLDIEKSRWGDLLTVEFEVAAAVEGARIPSLLLLPLVENALKYGRATSRGAMTIRVVAQRGADSALEIAIANSGEWVNTSGAPSVPSLGIGLENLRQRLARYYAGRHEFTHDARAGWVVARLRLLAADEPPGGPSTPPPPHA